MLRQQVEGAERDRAALAAVKARLAAAEKQARATGWELEVTQQRLDRVSGRPWGWRRAKGVLGRWWGLALGLHVQGAAGSLQHHRD